jgi:DNA processing protein
VLSVLEPILGRLSELPPQQPEPAGVANREDGDAVASRVLALLGPTAITIDDLIRASGAAPAIVRMVLLELEIAGRLQRERGGLVALL